MLASMLDILVARTCGSEEELRGWASWQGMSVVNAMSELFGSNANVAAASRSPSSRASSWPLSASHRRAVLSKAEVAIRDPSGLNDTQESRIV